LSAGWSVMPSRPVPSACTHFSLAAAARSSFKFFIICPKVSSMSASGSAAAALSAVAMTSMPISGNFLARGGRGTGR